LALQKIAVVLVVQEAHLMAVAVLVQRDMREQAVMDMVLQVGLQQVLAVVAVAAMVEIVPMELLAVAV
jgi:hypothetical protein